MAKKQEASSATIEAPVEALENKAEDIELAPFREQDEKTVGSMTERYAAKAEIGKEIKGTVNGYLSQDAEKAYNDFALAWFDNNIDKMKEDGKVIPPNPSKEKKISMVLDTKGAMADIRKKEYKEFGGEALYRIEVLKNDIGKSQVPQETPFLLLNYLQGRLENGRKEAEELRVKAEAGDVTAREVDLPAKTKEIGEMFETMRSLAERTMHEDLVGQAESKVKEVGFPTKESFVETKADARGAETKMENDLIEKEWKKFKALPETQRESYQKQLGMDLEIPRVLGQKDSEFKKASLDVFHTRLRLLAKENGIDERAFYGLLDQGYKPYEKFKTKGLWIFGQTERIVVPTANGRAAEIPAKGYDDFIGGVEKKYSEKVTELSKKEAGDEWEKSHGEAIQNQVEKRVTELAKSPDMAEGELEKRYKDARERIIVEYAKNRLEKEQPKTKEQLAVLEKKFEGKGKKKDINNFMANVLFQRGRLEKLGDDFDDSDRRAMGGFLREWDIPADIRTTEGFTKEEYKKAKKTQMGLFSFIMKIVEVAIKPKVSKRKVKA